MLVIQKTPSRYLFVLYVGIGIAVFFITLGLLKLTHPRESISSVAVQPRDSKIVLAKSTTSDDGQNQGSASSNTNAHTSTTSTATKTSEAASPSPTVCPVPCPTNPETSKTDSTLTSNTDAKNNDTAAPSSQPTDNKDTSILGSVLNVVDSIL